MTRTRYGLIADYRVACGRMAEQWLVVDYLTMLRQTGLITDELATADESDVTAPVPSCAWDSFGLSTVMRHS